MSLRTVGWWLRRLGISRLRNLTPEGENSGRTLGWIRTAWPGHMIYLNVKKVDKIPDGGGCRAHGRGSRCDEGGQTLARGQGRLRLAAHRHRWVLPAGQHRGP